LSAAHLFGARLRVLRLSHGLSHRALAELVVCSPDLIAKLEKAVRRGDQRLISRCDEALGASGALVEVWLAAYADPRHRLTPSNAVAAAEYLPLIRRALDSREQPDDGRTRSVTELEMHVGTLVAWRLDSRYGQMAVGLVSLLPELHRAALVAGSASTRALLLQAYRCADALADKAGVFDMSARLIDLISMSAEASGDDELWATGRYVRAELFFANGDFAAGRQLLESSAGRLRPIAVAGKAAYGSLHMRAAVLAARSGDAVAARAHIREAKVTADQVPEGVYHGTAFGPASVRIHELSLALNTGDIGGAVALGRTWAPPPAVPAERRSHYFIDLGLALMVAEDLDAAAEALDSARHTAPEHVRQHQELRAGLAGVLARCAQPPRALSEFARWMGVLPRSAGVGE
jgi:transcriptional regulator with XRE-family HTH domain